MDVSLERDVGLIRRDLPEIDEVYPDAYQQSSFQNGFSPEPAFVVAHSDYEGGSRYCSFEVIADDGLPSESFIGTFGDISGGHGTNSLSGLGNGPLYVGKRLGNAFGDVDDEEDAFLGRNERGPQSHTFSEFGLHDRKMGSFQSDGGLGGPRVVPQTRLSFDSDRGGFVPSVALPEEDQSFSVDRAHLDTFPEAREELDNAHDKESEHAHSADMMTRSREVLDRWRRDNPKKKSTTTTTRRPLPSHTEDMLERTDEERPQRTGTGVKPTHLSKPDREPIPEVLHRPTWSSFDERTLLEGPPVHHGMCRSTFDDRSLLERSEPPFRNIYSTFDRSLAEAEEAFPDNACSTFDRSFEPSFRNIYSTFDENDIEPPQTLLTQDPSQVYHNFLPLSERAPPNEPREQPKLKTLNGLTLSSFDSNKQLGINLSAHPQDDPRLRPVAAEDENHIEMSQPFGSHAPNGLPKGSRNHASRSAHESTSDAQFFHSQNLLGMKTSLNSRISRLLDPSTEDKLKEHRGLEMLKELLPMSSFGEHIRGGLDNARQLQEHQQLASALSSYAGLQPRNASQASSSQAALGFDLMSSAPQSHTDRFDPGLQQRYGLPNQDLLSAALLACGSLSGSALRSQQRDGFENAQRSQQRDDFDNHRMPSSQGFQSLRAGDRQRYQREEEQMDWSAALSKAASHAASRKASAIIQDTSTTQAQAAAKAAAMLAEMGLGAAAPEAWSAREVDRSNGQRMPRQFDFSGAPPRSERSLGLQPGLVSQAGFAPMVVGFNSACEVSKLNLADQLSGMGGSAPSQCRQLNLASFLPDQKDAPNQASMHFPVGLIESHANSGIRYKGENGQSSAPGADKRRNAHMQQVVQQKPRVEWGEARTVMVRNIPPRYTQDMLLKEWPNTGNYDFLYLPICIDKKRNATYAFINFNDSQLAEQFYSTWHKQRLQHYSTKKPLDISPADVQGRDDNLLQIVRNKTFRIRNIHFQPAIFNGSERISLEDFLADLDLRMKSNGQSVRGVSNSERQPVRGE